MAGTHRRTSSDINTIPVSVEEGGLKRELFSQGSEFSFFQAMRLLRQGLPSQKEKDAKIRMRPKLDLSFPAGDIDRIESITNDEEDYYRITTTFLELYGAVSPLPTFYTEDLITEKNEDESVSRDFLDIIHQRLYNLLYKGWLKYRQYLQVVEERDHLSLERLYCLVGLGSRALQADRSDNYQLLRYIGLMTQFPRSAMGLKALICDALNGLPLTVIPCMSRTARIPFNQQCHLGISGSTLGADSYLGEEIEDRMGKLGISIGPLEQADFLRFTPGNEGYERLSSLTAIYLTDPVVVEVELVLAAGQAQTVCLSDPIRATLGVTTWVFSEMSLGEVRTRFILNRD